MKPEDKNIYSNTMKVIEDLRKLVSTLNEEVSTLSKKDEIDFVILTLRAIANYTDVLFNRLISHVDLPIEYTAVTTRNLFECYLLTSYLIKDTFKCKEFISQKTYDELEINEGFLSLTTKNTDVESINLIHNPATARNEVQRG